MKNEQYKSITGTEKSTTASKVDTGETAKTERVAEANDGGSQREGQREGLAGLSKRILTPDQEIDAALSDFIDAFYEDNTFNLRKV